MGAHSNFFAHCPHLVRLEITNIDIDTRLPRPPPPPSLHTIVVSCEQPQELHFVELMEGWRGILVRRIVAREVSSLRGVLPLLLASHMHPVELCLKTPDDAVTLAALPGDETACEDGAVTSWTINPSPWWASDFLGSIEKPARNRLMSISVSFARLGALFRGQLHLPGLKKIEISLSCAAPTESERPPVLSGDGLFLRAPNLRRVAFTFDKEYAHSLAARLEILQGALVTLRDSFRALIQYDAAPLNEVLVSRQIERECAGFARLAKEYTVIARRSWPLA